MAVQCLMLHSDWCSSTARAVHVVGLGRREEAWRIAGPFTAASFRAWLVMGSLMRDASTLCVQQRRFNGRFIPKLALAAMPWFSLCADRRSMQGAYSYLHLAPECR